MSEKTKDAAVAADVHMDEENLRGGGEIGEGSGEGREVGVTEERKEGSQGYTQGNPLVPLTRPLGRKKATRGRVASGSAETSSATSSPLTPSTARRNMTHTVNPSIAATGHTGLTPNMSQEPGQGIAYATQVALAAPSVPNQDILDQYMTRTVPPGPTTHLAAPSMANQDSHL